MDMLKKIQEQLKKYRVKVTAFGTCLTLLGTGATSNLVHTVNHTVESNLDFENNNADVFNSISNIMDEITSNVNYVEQENYEVQKAKIKEFEKFKKKHKHDYKQVSKKYKNNDDGTHTVIKKSKCKDCDKKKTKKVNKKHKFDNEIVVVNDEQEIHTCECGEEKYVNHIYTEWKKDENGITESRICKTCGHEISRVRAKLLEELVEGVDYIKTVNYKDNGDGTHSVKTKYKWIKSSGSLTMITKNSHDKKENWESLNDEQEINRCVCGYYETRSHDYDTAKDNGNGTESLQCKNCKNIMTRKKQQTITPSNPFMPSYPTPDSDISKHEHLWVKSGDSYYQTTESEHILKQDYKCSNSTCKETKTVIISKGNHLLVNWVPNQDGKTEKSICEKCGKTVIREIEKHNHKFNKIDEKITINADGTHIRTTIYECPEDKEQKTETKIENCTYKVKDFTADLENIECEVCQNVMTREHAIDNGVVDPNTKDTKYSCTHEGCNYSYTSKYTPTEPIHIDIESLISIDQNSLSFIYDGKEHSPIVTGFPDNVTPRYVSTKGTNAGEYTWRIEFDVPEGYVADPVEISYKIDPMVIEECNYNYDNVSGELTASYKGVLDTDISTITYSVNGEELTGIPVLDEFKTYKIDSNIEFVSDKQKNYILKDNMNTIKIFDVKRDNSWYDIDMDYQRNEDELTVALYLTAPNVPYIEDCILPAVTCSLDFDKTILDFDFDKSPMVGEDGWDVYINATQTGEHDIVFSPVDILDTLPNRVKVAKLNFKILSDANDTMIKIYNASLGTANDEYYFEFGTNESTLNINKTTEIETIYRSNDLQNDAIFQGDEEDEEEARILLQEYIDNGFSITGLDIENFDEYTLHFKSKEKCYILSK